MLRNLADLTLPTRTVHLPLSWDDPAYTVWQFANSCNPSGPTLRGVPVILKFIRRINGLDSVEDVRQNCFQCKLSRARSGRRIPRSTVATPLDPRHRLVTTKYNPARTWTAENSVGIGGAYLCVYGMEGRVAISS